MLACMMHASTKCSTVSSGCDAPVAYLRFITRQNVNMASVDVSVEVLNECQIQEVTLDGQEITAQ